MKRFMLFSGNQYYPDGGAMDFVGDFDTAEEAMAKHTPASCTWANVFDTDTKTIVNHADYDEWLDGDKYG